MTTPTFKRIDFNEKLEKHLIFELTPEKKLLSIVRDLKDVFPRQKEWHNLTEDKDKKHAELLEKFRRQGKLYKKVCQYWLNNNMALVQAFNEHFENTNKEIGADEVVKFFHDIKKKLSLNTKDIIIFIHIYLEQSLGIQLFEEAAKKIESEL